MLSGQPIVDWVRGCGYYLEADLWNSFEHLIGKTEAHNVRDGKRGIYKLLLVLHYNEPLSPQDMVKESHWQLIGYEGHKAFSHMTFKEYYKDRSHLY